MSIADFFTESIPEFFAGALTTDRVPSKDEIDRFEVQVAAQELFRCGEAHQAEEGSCL